jgi:hypothetical protein
MVVGQRLTLCHKKAKVEFTFLVILSMWLSQLKLLCIFSPRYLAESVFDTGRKANLCEASIKTFYISRQWTYVVVILKRKILSSLLIKDKTWGFLFDGTGIDPFK